MTIAGLDRLILEHGDARALEQCADRVGVGKAERNARELIPFDGAGESRGRLLCAADAGPGQNVRDPAGATRIAAGDVCSSPHAICRISVDLSMRAMPSTRRKWCISTSSKPTRLMARYDAWLSRWHQMNATCAPSAKRSRRISVSTDG